MRYGLLAWFLSLIFIITFYRCKSKDDRFDWSGFSNPLKDSIIYLEQRGRIPNSVAGVAAKEPVDYSTLEWILVNSRANQLEKLLYEYPNGEIKGIAVKGLIRKESKNLYTHLTFCLNQNINVRYSHSCQKLGGYFLRELTHGVEENLKSYFSLDEIDQLNKKLVNVNFNCD